MTIDEYLDEQRERLERTIRQAETELAAIDELQRRVSCENENGHQWQGDWCRRCGGRR